MPTPVLAIRQVSKSFLLPHVNVRPGEGADPRRTRSGRRDAFAVLRDINFEIPLAQTLGIVGANGSGKTTLLKILAGVMQPDSGSIVSAGRIGALLELGAGFHPELSGEENVHLNGAILGMGRSATSDFLARIIEFAELERFMDMPVKHYSSGMIVRLGFAIATQLRPDILLLDETFAVGDARFQTRALNRIREMRAAGMNLIVVSHNAELILELSDRVIWLDKGRIAKDGDPRQVLAAYRMEGGAGSSGGARVGARLLGAEAHAEARTDSAARIVEADILRSGEGNGHSSAADQFFDLRTGDPLAIEVGLEFQGGIDPAACEIEALFRRDDRQAVARSVIRLPPTNKESEGDSDAPFPRTLRADFDSVILARGEYEILLLLRRAGKTESSFVVGSKIRVVTPLPPDFDDIKGFRLVAEIPARWEAAAAEE